MTAFGLFAGQKIFLGGENIDKVRHLTVLGYPEGNPGAQIGGADYFHKIYPRRNVVGINRIADDEAGENPVIF